MKAFLDTLKSILFYNTTEQLQATTIKTRIRLYDSNLTTKRVFISNASFQNKDKNGCPLFKCEKDKCECKACEKCVKTKDGCPQCKDVKPPVPNPVCKKCEVVVVTKSIEIDGTTCPVKKECRQINFNAHNYPIVGNVPVMILYRTQKQIKIFELALNVIKRKIEALL